MVGFLSVLIPILAILIGVGWAFLVGVRRARVRAIVILSCFLVAVIAGIICTNISYERFAPLLDLLRDYEAMGDIVAFIENSQPLQEAAVSTVGAIFAPMVFFLTFFTLSFLSFVVMWIVFLIMKIAGMKRGERSTVESLIYGIVPMLFTIFVFITPVAAYLDIVPGVLDMVETVTESEDEFAADSNTTAALEMIDTNVEKLNKAPMTVVYRALGGKLTCRWLTSIEVGTEKSDLATEVNGITSFAGGILELTDGDIKSYGESEAEAIKGLAASLDQSLLIPTLAGEFIYGATDAWLVQNDDFMGMEKPKFEDSTTKMFEESFDHILEAFHKDARQVNALRNDFNTLANIISILARDGVFAGMNGENTDALVNTLSSGTTVNDLVIEIGKNESFKILITDITNIGMRAIGSSLKIPENADEIYAQFTDDIATALNDVKNSGMTEEEQKAQIVTAIRDAFAESGNELQLGDEVLGLYADTLLADFAEYDQITATDVEEFFRVFAEVNDQDSPLDQSAKENPLTIPLGTATDPLRENKKEYTSPAYAGKTTEQLKKGSGAGMLATVLNKIVEESEKGQSDEEFKTNVQDFLKVTYENYAFETGKDASKADLFAVVALEKTSVSKDNIGKTAVMQSAAELKVVTVKVTMEDLLVDAKAAAERLNSDEAVQNEAQAIQGIFGSAADIMDKISSNDAENADGMELLTSVATSLGNVLDNLSATNSVGEEKTNVLLVAVFQSETVRDSANLDLKTATELAKAATEKDEYGNKNSFTETMQGISTGANIANKLSKDSENLTEDDIREMLENMTPQTANMLKVYMSEERIMSFGVPEKNAPVSTELIQNLLAEMGNKQKYSDYDSETKGILKLFNLATAASKNETDTQQVFNRGNVKGKLDATAEDTVNSIFSSDMVCNAITATLYKEQGLVFNPFGLNISEGNEDYKDCKNAVEKYYQSYNGEKTDELRYRVDAVAALFGVEGIEYAD